MAENATDNQAPDTAPEVSDGIAWGPRRPAFETPGALAFQHAHDAHILLLVQKKNVPQRAHVIDVLGRLRNNVLMPLREQRVAEFDGEERLVSFMTMPQGEPVMRMTGGQMQPIPERDIRHVILPQLLVTLRALHEFGVAHRALHPSRLFYRSQGRSEISVGECFTTPAGLLMPVAFETIERAMADPAARGEGSPADDYYALGALILTLLLGRDLLAGRSEEQLLQSKVTQGSLAALVAGEEIPGGINTLLRGLLNDNPEDRWTAIEVARWLDNTPPRVHGAVNPWLFSRPVGFAGRNYSDRRALAHAMGKDVSAASSYIRRQDLAHWVTHYLPRTSNSPELINLVMHGDPRQRVSPKYNTPDHLVARFCALLDPIGPVRFRGFVAMPDGMGPLLAKAVADGTAGENILNAMISMTQGGLINALSEIRMNACPDQLRDMRARFSLGSRLAPIEVTGDEESLYRLVYGLNPGLPCKAGAFKTLWVDSAETVLRQLDKVLLGNTSVSVSDPHILAYLVANIRELMARYADKLLTKMNPEVQLLQLLEIYGTLQAKFGLGPLKGLTGVFGARVEPQVRRLRSRTRREAALRKLEVLIKAGNVDELARAFNIGRLLASDEQGWRRAQQRVRMIDMTLRRLAKPVSPRDPRALYRGAQAASGLAALILAITVMVSVI